MSIRKRPPRASPPKPPPGLSPNASPHAPPHPRLSRQPDDDPGFMELPVRQGRGARINPPNRFEPLRIEEDPAALDEEELRQTPTTYYVDATKTLLSRNDSPDIGFTYSLNPYRGCEHGCVYCYARPSHEYLGFSAGLDFETRILVKERAPELLAETFQKKSWEPQVVALSGNTDPYQPLERRLALTRGCLEVFLRHRNPVGIITKNYLVTRDLDLLEEMARYNLVHVVLSITTLRDDLVTTMEPRTSRPARRFKAIEMLAARGVPVSVNVAPIVPGLTDEEMPAILKEAASRGASGAGYTILRLPGAVEDIFTDWARREFPDRANKIIRRLALMRGGELTDNRFGKRMRGEGDWAELIARLFRMERKRWGLNAPRNALSTRHFRRLAHGQRSLFDGA